MIFGRRASRLMPYTFYQKSHVKRFLFLQFPTWERRRPRRLTGANIGNSRINQRNAATYKVFCGQFKLSQIRAGEDAGVPRPPRYTTLQKECGIRRLAHVSIKNV
jgi:hypothetical protein